MSFLDAHLVVRRPGLLLDVQLTAEPGDVLAVIGPNGAGKTTLLRALAGLDPIDDGAIDCAGRSWDDGRGAPAPVQERRVGMVFQQQLLFPHLSVLENAAFGPRSRGRSRAEARRLAQAWLDRLGVGDLAHRRPGQVSGGQAQRVAIARALAGDPALLLLDEPLAALDVGVAMALRLELAEHLAAFPGVTVLVTHDPLDTMTLAGTVVVLDQGRVAQVGSPAEVAQRPRTDHVARLVGLNLLRGVSHGTEVRLSSGDAGTGDPGTGRHVVTTTPFTGEVFVTFSPAAVTLTRDEPTGSARNRWQGVVRSVVPHGPAVRVHLEASVPLIADVTPESATRLSLTPGRRVWAAVKATEMGIYGTSDTTRDEPIPSRYV